METNYTMLNYVEKTPSKVLENSKISDELTKLIENEFLSGSYSEINIIASGSSFNSSHCAKPLMEKVLGLRVNIISPLNFTNYYKANDKDFNFVISQSGYSTNAIEALIKLKQLNLKAIGLTGNTDSDMKNYCDHLIDYKVGIETVGYVTMGVLTLIQFLMTFAINVSYKQSKITLEEKNNYLNNIIKAMELHKEIQEKTHVFIEKNYKSLSSMTKVYVCSTGAGMGIAYEAALKVGETVKVPSFSYEIEEYIHGPNLQLTPEYTVFIIDTNDNVSDRVKQVYKASKAVTDNAFLIGSKVDDNSIFTSENLIPEMTPLYYLPFFQILSFKITEDLTRWKQHPLLKEFKKIAAAKTENYKDSDD